jgi:hypothetical protein
LRPNWRQVYTPIRVHLKAIATYGSMAVVLLRLVAQQMLLYLNKLLQKKLSYSAENLIWDTDVESR